MINSMRDISGIVAFTIDGQRYALPLPSVLRVLPVVEITPIPGAPSVIMGMVDIHGTVIPVADMRKRMGMAPREQALGDKLIIIKTAARTLAITADDVAGVVSGRPEDFIEAGEVAPGIKHIKGVAKIAGGLTLIYDMDGFLSIEEERALDSVMKTAASQDN